MNFDPVTLKVGLMISAVAAFTVPKIGYVAANGYIRTYNVSANYLSEVKEKALYTVGLQSVKPESTYDDMILKTSGKYKIDPRLLKALIGHESKNDSDAFSPKGAIGLAQIMPFNAVRCKLKKKAELWDDAKNIDCGGQILSEELITYKGNVRNALMSYNGGPNCVKNVCAESVKHSTDVMNRFASAAYKVD